MFFHRDRPGCPSFLVCVFAWSATLGFGSAPTYTPFPPRTISLAVSCFSIETGLDVPVGVGFCTRTLSKLGSGIGCALSSFPLETGLCFRSGLILRLRALPPGFGLAPIYVSLPPSSMSLAVSRFTFERAWISGWSSGFACVLYPPHCSCGVRLCPLDFSLRDRFGFSYWFWLQVTCCSQTTTTSFLGPFEFSFREGMDVPGGFGFCMRTYKPSVGFIYLLSIFPFETGLDFRIDLTLLLRA